MEYINFLFIQLKIDNNMTRPSFFGVMRLEEAHSLRLIFTSTTMATSLSTYFLSF